jgi:ParB/RepB/Spo0J family partition protein
MTVERIPLSQIKDNPYQPRSTYHRKDIDDLAYSIELHGLMQVPPGRRKGADVELAFGHLRKRAYDKLAKKDSGKWGEMPVEIRSMTDDQMAMFALEENVRRADITPMDQARAIDKYLKSFLKKTEVEVARALNISKGAVSNMRRVLQLPDKFLEKIDAGVINFTQGRELLVLEGLENSENLMSSALAYLKTGNKSYGHANTVEGLQASIYDVIRDRYPPLDKAWGGWRWDILFDTRAAGCLQCEKMIRTHPTKSATAHYCLDPECWKKKDQEHRDKAAAAAKKKMEKDILQRTAAAVKQAEKITEEVAIVDNADEIAAGEKTVAGVLEEAGKKAVERQPLKAPKELLEKAKAAAGTRAEVLDLRPLRADNYSMSLVPGHALLDGILNDLEDPEECLQRCTTGFHYAFDSKYLDREASAVCTNTQCLAKKKAALTRKRNAAGQARKKAESKAIKQAIAGTTVIDKSRMKLILYAQIAGRHIERYGWYNKADGKAPDTWLWDKISPGIEAPDRTTDKLFKRIEKLSEQDLAVLLVEFMFYYLTDKGDIGTYEIKAAQALKWLGVEIEKAEAEEKAAVPAGG